MNKTLSNTLLYFFTISSLFWTTTGTAQRDIFFSEYVEGSANNKCLEFFNPTDERINLAAYTVEIYGNGASTPVGIPWDLSGKSIGSLETLVLCSGLADAPLQATEDGHFGFGSFNGNDAIVLKKNGRAIDIIGGIGCNPGGAWSSGGKSTKDATLIRIPCIEKGNVGGGCGFSSLNTEWIAFPKDYYNNLGTHDFELIPVEIVGNNALCENPSIELTALPNGIGTYRWSTGSTSNKTTVTSPGLYTVTVTTSQCNIIVEKRINGTSPEITAAIASVKAVSCRPKTDGQVVVSASGGSGGFTYQWRNGSSTNNNISGLGAGEHIITVTDNNGCFKELPVTINGATTVPLNTPIVQGETCKNRGDGSIILSASGNNLKYSIDGNNFQDNGSFTDLSPGKYPVLVINAQGCGDSKQVTVNGGTSFDLRKSIVTQSKCEATGGGQVILKATGGQSPFQISFDGAPFTNNLVYSNLKGGTYPFIVKDASGCQKEFEQIIDKGSDMMVDFSKEDATCAGIDDGIISFLVTGNLNYPWISYHLDNAIVPKRNITEFEGLSVGKHTVLIRDSLDCRITGEFTIEEKTKLNATITTEAICSVEPTGRITVLPQNGEAPYTYSLDSGAFSSNHIFENLPSNTYQVITKDNQGCMTIDTAEIIPTGNLEIVSVNNRSESCSGDNDGQLRVITNSLDSTNIEYSINGIDYQLVNLFSGLSPKEYMVYARKNGCADSTKVTIEPINPITFLSATTRAPMCGGGNDGQIRVNALGGKEPYLYQLNVNSFQASNIFNGLPKGNYSITLKDANGCEATSMVQLDESMPATPSCSVIQNVSKKGEMDGAAMVEILGGAAPFNVQLLNANFNNRISLDGTETFENLAGGTYIVDVTDRNGCKNSCEFTIEEPLCALSITTSKRDVTCFEGSDGHINLEIENGSLPFDFNWSDDRYDGQQNSTDLTVGTYQIIVNDNVGCIDTASVNINEPDQLTINILVANPTICEKDSTQLSVDNSFDKYLWSNDSKTADILVIEAGEYKVTVVDGTGCAAEDSIMINTIQKDTIYQNFFTCQLDQVGTSNTEERGVDGCFDIIYSTFVLARKDTTLVFTTTCDPSLEGVSSFILPNIFGCDSLIITNTELLRRDTTFLFETSCDSDQIGIRQEVIPNAVGCDSLLIIETTLNFAFDTDFKTVFTCNTEEAIIDTLILKNIIGCDSLIITSTELLRRDTTFLFETSCDSDQVGIRQEVLQNTVGCDSLLIIETLLNDEIDHEFKPKFTCNPVEAIIDTLVLKNNSGCDSLIITQTILNPSNLTELQVFTCEAANVGIDTLSLFNQFQCDSLVITTTLLAEKHFIELTELSCNPQDTGFFRQELINQFGCDSVVETRIGLAILNDCQIIFNAVVPTVCANETTGTINLQSTEGNPPFDYYILNTTQQDTFAQGIILSHTDLIEIKEIPVGNFIIKLANQGSITATENISILQFPIINIDAVISNYNSFAISCEGETDGSIKTTVTGGQSPYNYLWNTGKSNKDLQNLATGNYALTITDDNNCIEEVSFDLSAPNTLNIDYQSLSPNCFDDEFGSIMINNIENASGTAEYSLDGSLFQPIGNLPFTVNALKPENYQLFIQDENDCQWSDVFTIPIPNENSLTLGNTQSLVLGDSITLKPKANFDIAHYEWTSTDETICQSCAEITVKPTGSTNYQLTTYDANGCSLSDFILVNVRTDNQVYLPNIFSPNGDGQNDIYQIYTGNSIRKIKSFDIVDYEGRRMYKVIDQSPTDNIGWDGIFNGQKMLPAVFIVFVKVELLDGTEREYIQTMNLVK